MLNRTRKELKERNRLYQDSQVRCSDLIHKLSDEKSKNLELQKKLQEFSELQQCKSDPVEERSPRQSKSKIMECHEKTELKRKLNDIIDKNEDGKLDIKITCTEGVYRLYRFKPIIKSKKRKNK